MRRRNSVRQTIRWEFTTRETRVQQLPAVGRQLAGEARTAGRLVFVLAETGN